MVSVILCIILNVLLLVITALLFYTAIKKDDIAAGFVGSLFLLLAIVSTEFTRAAYHNSM